MSERLINSDDSAELVSFTNKRIHEDSMVPKLKNKNKSTPINKKATI